MVCSVSEGEMCGKSVGNTMQQEMSQTGRSTRGRGLTWHMTRWCVVLVALVMLLLTACDSGSGSPVSAAGTPGSSGGANAPTATSDGTATAAVDTATPTPISGPGAQFGSSQFCSQKPSVSVQLPPTIPAYPNAELRLSQADGANSIYGLCTTSAVSVSIQFYADQLPGKGWQQLQRNSNTPVEQITAKRSGNNVTITIYPDAVIANETDIIIQLSAA